METVASRARRRSSASSEAGSGPELAQTWMDSHPLPVDYPGPLAVDSSANPEDGRWSNNSCVKKHHHKHNLKHRYELLETLGRGTYGKVKKAIERHTGRVVSSQARFAIICCQNVPFDLGRKIKLNKVLG